MTSGSTDASSRDAAVDVVDHRASCPCPGPSREPGAPCAAMRWKCTDTPSGANAIISGLNRWVPRRQQKPQPRSPTDHRFSIALSRSPSPPFRGEREGPRREAAGRVRWGFAESSGRGGPHLTPTLSAPRGGEGEVVALPMRCCVKPHHRRAAALFPPGQCRTVR